MSSERPQTWPHKQVHVSNIISDLRMALKHGAVFGSKVFPAQKGDVWQRGTYKTIDYAVYYEFAFLVAYRATAP